MMNWKAEIGKIFGEEEIFAINIEGILFTKKKIGSALKRLDHSFDDSPGGQKGLSFWAWSESKIVFCCTYDGMEWAEVLPRNPDRGIPVHVGGE